MDDFCQGLGCMLYGLAWTAGVSALTVVVLVSLILAGVL